MHLHHTPSTANALWQTQIIRVCCAAFVLLVSSCTSGLQVQQQDRAGGGAVPPPIYTIVCVIHGDGDYRFHDTSGVEYDADAQALAGIEQIAEDNPRAEVFIFHQKVRRHSFLFFPKADGEFLYYRCGQRMVREAYWRNDGGARFEPEAAFYHRYHTETVRDTATLFLYYGHEIPEVNGEGYDASERDRQFTVSDLAAGLHMFQPAGVKFDLLVLSTCYGGTPYTIGALGPFACTIVASPDNLHLSYFDYSMLARLDQQLAEKDVSSYAKRFASHSFDILTRRVHTAVSVAVYDVDSVQHYVHAVHALYGTSLTKIEKEPHSMGDVAEHYDCADVPAYSKPDMSVGVIVNYRPAQFGRSKNKLTHSGWECWRMPAQQPRMPGD